MNFKDIEIRKIGTSIQLTGAVYSGEGYSYILQFPEYTGDNTGETVDVPMSLEDWKALLHQGDKVEVEVLSKTKDGELYKAVVRKCERNIAQSVSWNVFRRDGYKCRYCAKDDVPLTVDHAITWESGGPSIEGNLVSSCRKCNMFRGDTPFVEWLQHKYYLDVYRNLTSEARYQNELLAGNLAKIPLVINVRSR